jgi:acyl-CoA synthetase (NDP forming)
VSGPRVAFISQSGALCTAALDWSLAEYIGFSVFISVGSMLDVGWGDLIDHLGEDPQTESILLYVQSIGDAPAFMPVWPRDCQPQSAETRHPL